MYKKTFGFHEQKKLGDQGESDFLKFYSHFYLEKLSGRECDFLLNGKFGIELKTDLWLLKDTPNIFLETISNHKNSKEGGVYRAEKDGAAFFVYYFVKDKTFLWYRTRELCEFLRQNENKFEKKIIRNHGYTSEGRLVPRTEVERFLFRKDVF